MPAFTASAPGKIILFGEHAVVYHRPALAVPVTQVRAQAIVIPDLRGAPGRQRLLAPDMNTDADLSELPDDHPLVATTRNLFESLEITRPPAYTLKITSTIPIAAGLGSGAAITVATLRSLSAFLGRRLTDEAVNKLTFEVEKLYHGTPSGIDNTVITYAQPVYFRRDQPIERFHVAEPFTIVIADTGIRSPTSVAVGDVRKGWQADPERFEASFDAITNIVEQAREAIETGKLEQLGPLMTENHIHLQEIGVSSPALDALVNAAIDAGAFGAKLSGGGRGGNMIALTSIDHAETVAEALKTAGASHTLTTTIT
jgi:mevalonate kinase